MTSAYMTRGKFSWEGDFKNARVVEKDIKSSIPWCCCQESASEMDRRFIT